MEPTAATELREVVGALVFGSDRPLSLRDIRICLREVAQANGGAARAWENLSDCDVEAALGEVQRALEECHIGFRLAQVAGGYRLQSHPACAAWLKHLLQIGSRNRLSLPGLETLSIIAYRQPVTRAEIEKVRGVNVDHIIHHLLELQMIRICGRRTDLPGRPFLYGTTQTFLEHFGLKSLKDLEDLDPLLARRRESPPAPPATGGGPVEGPSSGEATEARGRPSPRLTAAPPRGRRPPARRRTEAKDAMQRVAILGLGLMGGSLGMALRERKAAGEVVGYARRAPTRRAAVRLGAADRVTDRPEHAVAGADCVVLCVPVLAMPPLLEQCRHALEPGCVVTDVGSTKAWLARRFESVLRGTGAGFVGSHPMAGSEAMGLEAARSNLYDGALVFVTPAARRHAARRDARHVHNLWRSVGARTATVSPEMHDRIAARVSHVVHLAAVALVANLHRRGGGRWRPFCGSGMLDTTRVAAGSEVMWHDILRTNRDAIHRELVAYAAEIERIAAWLSGEDWGALRQLLRRSRSWRLAMERSRR
jgi:prephenate dehydrogenase